MAGANLSRAESVLLNTTDLLRTQYFDDVERTSFRKGRITERWFKPAEEIANGDGIEEKIITGRTDSARASLSPYKDFGKNRRMKAAKLKYRFDDSATSNDFTRLEGVAEIPHLELTAGDPDALSIDTADEVERQLMENVQDSFSLLALATGTGRVALVNGTPTANNHRLFASATGSATSSGRIAVDSGSVAPFERGMRFDFYSAAGVLAADEVSVIDMNSADKSVGIETSQDTTVADLSNIATNDEIFRSGERNQGYRGSVRNWLEDWTVIDALSPVENFIGGKNRATAANWHLLPINTREGATAVQVKREHLDDQGIAMGYVHEEGNTIVVAGNIELIQALRRSIGEEALRMTPPDHGGDFTFGENQLSYVHPQFGLVVLNADPMAPLDRLFVLNPPTWKRINYAFRGFEFMPGTIGMFRQKEGESATGEGSVFFRAEGYKIDTLACMNPRNGNGCIHNLTA